MATMTSLQAQNRFGEMLDTSQREPVVITRRGRPVSIVISVSGEPSDLHYQWMRTMSNLYPLRGQEAIDAINQTTSQVRANTQRLGLTEEQLTDLLNEKE
jgi:prevent-host-death family protein